MKRKKIAVIAVLVALFYVKVLHAQGTEAYEQPPINYSATQPHDAISRLQARLIAGDAKLNGNDREIVQTLLRELGVRAESQLLVFSKTSFQRSRIRPDQPRALYFSDTCYVGWVPGGLIEITTIDPQLGPIFYSFDPEPKERKFVRDSNCMTCHGGTFVRGIPGVFARSLFPSETGEPLLHHGSEVVDFRTAFTNRWGGWYVTGKHGAALHRGNVLAHEKNDQLVVDLKRGANLTDLSRFFDTDAYLEHGSDIVALLIFEQQTAIQNTITRASLECRRMLEYQKALQRDLKEPVTEELTYDSVKRVFDGDAKDLVDDLWFKDEAELPAGLEGSPGFQKAFVADSRHAKDGNSLKDLDLKGKLFRNRCSYLIYSESFLALPQQLKQRVYARLGQALHPKNPLPEYAYLGADERARITGILRKTHPEFAKATSN
jgi:hypothetical protein